MVTATRNVQIMKPVQNWTGFIFCTFPGSFVLNRGCRFFAIIVNFIFFLDEKKRKTKWDSDLSSHIRAGNVAAAINQSVANLTSSATGTKSTVIPATGTISKKPNK